MNPLQAMTLFSGSPQIYIELCFCICPIFSFNSEYRMLFSPSHNSKMHGLSVSVI